MAWRVEELAEAQEAALEDPDAEHLASPQFLARAKRETSALLADVRELIAEARTSLGEWQMVLHSNTCSS